MCNEAYDGSVYCKDPSSFMNTKWFDAVIFEDVQVKGVTSQKEIMQLVVSGLKVGIICHVQKGQLGAQGNSGLWIRRGNDIYSFAHLGDAPYVDTEDMTWILGPSIIRTFDKEVSMYTEQIDGNVFICSYLYSNGREENKVRAQ